MGADVRTGVFKDLASENLTVAMNLRMKSTRFRGAVYNPQNNIFVFLKLWKPTKLAHVWRTASSPEADLGNGGKPQELGVGWSLWYPPMFPLPNLTIESIALQFFIEVTRCSRTFLHSLTSGVLAVIEVLTIAFETFWTFTGRIT